MVFIMAHFADTGVVKPPEHSSKILELIHNLLVALTVSFIALSLGAAFGVLSGRGAFAGMFSAGIIAFICGALGGTRVQCSGPVAPMAAVMAGITGAATADYAMDPMALGGVTPSHFLNMICFICGGFLLLFAALRTGFLITYVPDAVISGFMTGISLIIWIGQTKFLFGLDDTKQITGSLPLNIFLVIFTIALIFWTGPFLKRFLPKLGKVVPGTLAALVIATIVADVLRLDVQHVSVDAAIPGWDGFVELVKAQIPQNVTQASMWKALPYGLEFALICYLDTLMVALIIDRLRGEKTRKNKELMAQGVANTAVGFIGGVPGTQASIRSVLMTKEGATMRLAGAMVGVFVIIEMLMLQSWLALIPQAAFVGILMKVGWDVCDDKPIRAYIMRKADRPKTLDFITIVGTALLTVYSLTLAVLLFTAFYYAVNWYNRKKVEKHPTEYMEDRVEEIKK